MNSVIQCRVCERYKMTDGTWGEADKFSSLLLALHKNEIEIVLSFCPNCEEIKRGYPFKINFY